MNHDLQSAPKVPGQAGAGESGTGSGPQKYWGRQQLRRCTLWLSPTGMKYYAKPHRELVPIPQFVMRRRNQNARSSKKSDG